MRKFTLPLLLFAILILLSAAALNSYQSTNEGKLLANEFFSALPAGGYGTQRALRSTAPATNDASILDQGILYHQQKDYDLALVSLRAYLQNHPVTKDHLPGLLASSAAFATGRYEEAQEHIQNMSRDSRSARAAYHWQSALLDLRRENFASAHFHLEEVITLDSTGYNAEALLSRISQTIDEVE